MKEYLREPLLKLREKLHSQLMKYANEKDEIDCSDIIKLLEDIKK